jgi:polysaccharide export outer membrane protein
VPVRPDGKISLPLLNDVQAAGLTPMQLRATLITSLERYIPSPLVSVIVREVHSFKVTVIGEVKTPGRYELRSRTTVLDVLAMAGGLSQYAARGRITILRRDGDAVRELPYDFEKIARKAGPRNAAQENYCVQPGDIIVVP